MWPGTGDIQYARGTAAAGTLARSIEFGSEPPHQGSHDALERWRDLRGTGGHTVGELAIAWLLAKPIVASVIAGSTPVEQLRKDAAAADWMLTTADIAELDQWMRPESL